MRSGQENCSKASYDKRGGNWLRIWHKQSNATNATYINNKLLTVSKFNVQ